MSLSRCNRHHVEHLNPKSFALELRERRKGAEMVILKTCYCCTSLKQLARIAGLYTLVSE